MNEEFLHYLWLHKKLPPNKLTTAKGKSIQIVQVGFPNSNAGPDFFNAQLVIDGQLWAGNLEIHCKSSDWYAHHHETDSAYENVILHVVWEHDVEVFWPNGSPIPVLELQAFVSPKICAQYKDLMHTKRWIPCENQFPNQTTFITQHFLERLFVERLEVKTKLFFKLLQCSNNDWEAVLFQSLAKGFGLNVNSDSFLATAQSIPFSLIRKISGKPLILEALLMGQSGLLEKNTEEGFLHRLKEIYETHKQNYSLDSTGIPTPHFFRLRPNNFPTLRLSQLATLYQKNSSLFSDIIEVQNVKEFYNILQTKASVYWETHYTFGKNSKKRLKSTTKGFTDLLIVNTIIPLRFCYDQYLGRDTTELLFSFARSISSENNTIVKKFKSLGLPINNAMESQFILQLKQQYCNKKQCLKCTIGNSLVSA